MREGGSEGGRAGGVREGGQERVREHRRDKRGERSKRGGGGWREAKKVMEREREREWKGGQVGKYQKC